MNGITGGLSIPSKNSMVDAAQSAGISAGPNAADAPIQKEETKRAFSDVWNDIQAKMGGKEEKPREIKKTLDKDAFLKIMVTQMRQQDPTKPLDAEKMAAELAQIASVEQLQTVNKNIEKLTQNNQPAERLAMSGFIGKTVTVDRNRFEHVNEAKDMLGFNLTDDAASVKVALVSDTGETVLEKDLGPRRSGANEFIWDGKKGNSLAAKPGVYTLKIDARTENGAPVTTETRVKAHVTGVSFEGKEPVLVVGNGERTDKILLKNVIQVDGDSIPVAPKESNPQSKSSLAGKGQFFTFEKGVGSKPMDMNHLAPEAQAAIQKFVQKSSGNAQVETASADVEKGFPNGLSESQASASPIEPNGEVEGGEEQ